MHEFLLLLHSWLRWVVLGLGLYAIYLNYTGWKSQRTYTATDKRINTFFIASLHTQILLGLILYAGGISPFMQTVLSDMKLAMKDRELRFYAVEHITGMIIGVVIAQIGSIKAKKAKSDTARFKTAVIWFTIALLIILLMIPFGIWNSERPMFRM